MRVNPRGSSAARVFAATAVSLLFVMTASVAMADPVLPSAPLRVTSAGKTFTHPTPASLISTASVVQTQTVSSWVDAIASRVYSRAANATCKLDKKHRKLKFKAARTGYRLRRPQSVTAIISELKAEVAGATPRTVALPTTATKPKITKFGKQLLVVLKRRKIYLYNNNRIQKAYRCAVGTRRYPTPTGTFHVARKVKNPSWHNGHTSWSRNMPEYIGPGPNNPLGTRALYLYSGRTKGHDTGVRIHGVPRSKNRTIGHAASHGCLRMRRKDVENLYPRVPKRTIVYIIK